jgi:hypothetical protein
MPLSRHPRNYVTKVLTSERTRFWQVNMLHTHMFISKLRNG